MIKTLSRFAFWILLLVAVALVVGVNAWAPNPLPQEPRQQIDLYQRADLPAKAEAVLADLLAHSPHDLDLHYTYINNHFEISDTEDEPRDDGEIEAYYAGLTERPELADVGHYGLGLIQVNLENYQDGLEHYQRVQDREQKYLNNSIGYAYKSLGRPEQAVPYFWREIELGGNLDGAVGNLVEVYLEGGQLDELRALMEDQRTAPYVGLGAERELAFRTADVVPYLSLTFITPLTFIELEAALSALLICAMWFLYFWRIDVFEQEPLRFTLSALLLGALSALFSALPSDLLQAIRPSDYDGTLLNDLVYSIAYTGLVEETVKFIPVWLITLFSRQVDEPIDLVIYGSLSALGFATLENSLYFTGYGLGIVFTRFLLSTVLHISMTSLICYFWARTRYIRPGNSVWAFLSGLALAATGHGLFNFFLTEPWNAGSILSVFGLLGMAMILGRIIKNCLNFSPHFDVQLSRSERLSNYKLLLSTSVLLLLIGFFYHHHYLWTDLANERLLPMGVFTVVSVLVVFGALGEFGLARGRLLSLTSGEAVGAETDPEPGSGRLGE